MREPAASVDSTVWRRAGVMASKRLVPEETAVAFSYDGGTYAVMMATPQNLDDFALGFSLTEGIIAAPADIRQLDVVEFEAGGELRMWLAEPRAAALTERRRPPAGPARRGFGGSRKPRGGGGGRSRPARTTACWAPAAHAGTGDVEPTPRAQPPNTRRACRGILAVGRGACCRARGCRPSQCARQACRRSIRRCGYRARRHGASHKPRVR